MASLHHPPAYKTVCNTHSKSITSSKLPMCHWKSESHELLCHTSKHNHTEHPSSAEVCYVYEIVKKLLALCMSFACLTHAHLSF
jgi:hypothetical protein